MLTRRSIVAAGLLAPQILGTFGAGAVPATIRIINPFPPGGPSDAIARLLQPGLRQRLGTTVIVENRPGASASIGATLVARAPPDGATWLLAADSFVVSSLLMKDLPYDVQKDFAPVTMVARGAMVLCASAAKPYRTLSDVVTAAKAAPGTLTYATTGIGSNGHLTMAAIGQITGAKFVHVPYRGMAPAANDALAGHVDLIISSTASLAPFIESKQFAALVQCGERRAAFLPDTPTAKESGLGDMHAYSWFGFFAPSATPKPIIDQFYREVVASAREAAVADVLVNKFRVELVLPTPEELRATIAEELPFWAKIIRDNNIKSDS
jgi:tripartite-type tricarboxylate transporter receptor subunit TctC